MNEWGIQAAIGKRKYPIKPQTVNTMFRNKFYMGILTSKQYHEEVKGQHVPMVTEEQFYKVQAILDGRNVNKIALAKRNSSNPDFPLRRVVKCGKCGKGLTAGWSKGQFAKFPYYRCGGKCTGKSIRPDVLETSLVQLLKEITPKKECTELFLHFLYKTYHQRLSRLNNIKNEADNEIIKLKELRKMIVEKNLTGIYSDEIFKEQNAVIEEKIMKEQIAKDDTTIDKYNIEDLTTFIKTLLADLGEAYKRSNTSQLKVLLGSIFPSGTAWNYSEGLNCKISPLYQSIRTFDRNAINTCAEAQSRTAI